MTGLTAPCDKQEVKKEEEMVSQSKIKIGIKGFRAEDCSTKQIEFPVKKLNNDDVVPATPTKYSIFVIVCLPSKSGKLKAKRAISMQWFYTDLYEVKFRHETFGCTRCIYE